MPSQAEVIPLPPVTQIMCDACSVAVAVVEIRMKEGSVYLCGHHSKKHKAHIITKKYGIRELG